MVKGPQIENGYTKIADEFLEALIRYRGVSEQMRCFLFILRKTWGWEKKEDQIALSQFVAATGLTKPHICRALKSLEQQQLITAKSGNTKAKIYRINKQFENWKLLPKKATLPKSETVIAEAGNDHCQSRQQALPGLATPINTIDTITIKTSTRDTSTINTEFDLFWSSYPKKKSKGQAKKTWAKLKKAKTFPGIQIILNAIAAQKAGHDWQQEGGKYIPHPSTWLNNEGWLDEVSEPLPPESKASRRMQNNMTAMHRAKDLIK